MKPEDYNLIEQYLDGQLSEEARTVFEARLASEKDLAEALTLRREMNRHLMRRDRRIELKQTLAELADEHFEEVATSHPEAKIVPMRGRRWLAYAASIAILAIIAFSLYYSLRPGLYNQYAQHPPLALTQLSSQAETLGPQAEQAFNQKDYEQAFRLLEQYLEAKEQEDPLAHLYLGISALETERYEEAIQTFSILSTQTGQWQDYGQWYLALTYLKMGDKTACRAELSEISEASEWFGKAQELLEKL